MVCAQPISPFVVGNNLWYADTNAPSSSPSTSVMNLSGQAGVRLIRIGGAGFDGGMPSDSTLLTWVNRIRATGAEPLIQVSQYRTSAQAAAEAHARTNSVLAAELEAIRAERAKFEPETPGYIAAQAKRLAIGEKIAAATAALETAKGTPNAAPSAPAPLVGTDAEKAFAKAKNDLSEAQREGGERRRDD